MLHLVSSEPTTLYFTLLASQPTAFLVSPCVNSTNIGSSCSISGTACATLMPCQNDGNCTNIDTVREGYLCACVPGFNGTQCQWDRRPCQSDTCLNNGLRISLSHKHVCEHRFACRNMQCKSTERVHLLVCTRLAGSTLRDTGGQLCECDMSQQWRVSVVAPELHVSMPR